MNTKLLTGPKDPPASWKGYSLDELRYQRALNMARIEIAKHMIATQGTTLYENTFKMSGGNRGGIVGKLMSTLSVMDYSVIAFRLGSKLFSLYRSFRK